MHAAFLASIDAVAASTEALEGASEVGVDPLLNTLLQEACSAGGITPERYLESLSTDGFLRDQIQEHVARLTAQPAYIQAQRRARLRDLERHLYVFRYMLSGDAPPLWVWQSLDPDERLRLQVARQEKEEADPQMLAMVQHALSKAGTSRFGLCDSCDGVIQIERLQLLPWAERCVTCQRAHEGAPVEDDADPIAVHYF